MRRAHRGLAVAALFIAGATLAGFTMIAGSGGSQPARVGVADIGGPFTLTDQDGRTVTQADFTGKPTVIFFGFTMCPDVCPTTLYELSGIMQELGSDADKLNVAFVSVDWERDGPAQVARYMQGFDSRFRGLSGTREQIAAAADAFKVHVERVPIDGGYTFDHTASVFLMNADGRFVGTLSYDEPGETKLAKMRRLAEGA